MFVFDPLGFFVRYFSPLLGCEICQDGEVNLSSAPDSVIGAHSKLNKCLLN